jgi:excisionase family DNA binding protein
MHGAPRVAPSSVRSFPPQGRDHVNPPDLARREMSRPVMPGLLRIEEAAAWLGLSKRKTYELVYRGDIPSVYIGRSRRITFSALEAFVARLPENPA